MNVTYSDSIGNGVLISTLSSRVLTQNLLDNDKINPHFSNAIITIPFEVMKYLKQTIFIKKVGKEKYLESSYMKFLKHVLAQNYKDSFINTLKGDYLLYSMSSFDYTILSHVLNGGMRVVAGGCEVNMSSFEEIRKKFLLCGTKEENLKNLLLIKGIITPRTDLYSPIKNWKDCFIPTQGIEDIMLYANNDYTRFESMLKIKKIIDLAEPDVFKQYVWPNVLSVCFNSKCIWGKCRFCMYCVLDDINFIENLTAEQIIESIYEKCVNLNCYTVFFADDYFYFNKKRITIMDELLKRGIKFICQTGIRLLVNEKYVERLHKYFYMYSIGLESATNFGLNQFNKGYEWKDIQKSFENIKKYYNNNAITINIIVDGPVESVENANLNYKRLLDIKQDLESHNIKVIHTISVLTIYNENMFNNFASLGYIRKPISNNISGKIKLIKELEKYVELPYGWTEQHDIPFERIDKNGNLLSSDYEIVDEDVFTKLVDQSFFYHLRKKEEKNDKKI